MIDLSIILPTIRVEKLPKLFESFAKSFSGSYEWIVVSPYDIPEEISSLANVKVIRDWGSPLRCQQIGLAMANGVFLHRAVDDSLYLPGAMDEIFELTKQGIFYINIKFIEGEGVTHRDMSNPGFYELKYHMQALAPYVPHHFQVVNFMIIERRQLLLLGGWDCQFETIAIGELDLSLRMQFHGLVPVLSKNIVLKCDWMPGRSGDHAPLHDAFDEDMKKYREIYSQPSCEDRIKISFGNWMNSPAKWTRRFHD